MSNLLTELKKLKPKLPEVECFVPEWGRTLKLRALTVKEGRALRAGEFKPGTSDLLDVERFRVKGAAYAIVDDHGDRPLANDDGIALIESLSEDSLTALITAYGKLSADPDAAKKSEATGNGALSSDSPVAAAEQSLS